MPAPTVSQSSANGKPPRANGKPPGKPKGGKREFAPGATVRSRVTNGKQTFVDRTVAVDERWRRRFCDIISLHTADLGGVAKVTAAQASIIRRVATQTIELELLEQKFATSGKGASADDLDLYARISNSLGRHLDRIGLKRVPKDAKEPPTIDEIAEEIEREAEVE